MGGGSAAPDSGFAISSNVVSHIAGQLVKHGKISNPHRASLDIYPVTVTGPSGQPAGVGIGQGVPDGSAALTPV
jgi:S1-C subfamily serine protease